MAGKTLRVVVSDDEASIIESRARLAGKSVSSYLKELGLKEPSHTDSYSQEYSQHSQDSAKVSQLECMVLAMQTQLAEVSQQLAKLANKDSQLSDVRVEALTPGMVITGQQGKLYNTLLRSKYEAQIYEEKDHKGRVAKTPYRWFKELGLICATDVGVSRSGQIKFRVVGVLEPGMELELTAEGGFMHLGAKWFCVTPEEHSQYSQHQSVCVEENSPDVAVDSEPLPPDAATQDAVDTEPLPEAPLQLSREELVQRLAKTPGEAKTLGATLSTLGGKDKKLAKILEWTRNKDPEGLAWKPLDEDRGIWLTHTEVSQ